MIMDFLVWPSQKLRHPAKSIRIAHFPHYRAHEQLNRANATIPVCGGVWIFSTGLMQAQRHPQLILGGCGGYIDFVPQHQKRATLE